jgi:nitrogen-specific signal transduction histidine kinase
MAAWACWWSRSTAAFATISEARAPRIRAAQDRGRCRVTIDDDGPGLCESAITERLFLGRRLDERGDGHGFGLSIPQELVQLSGLDLSLLVAPVLRGLRAKLVMPASI